MQSPTSCFENMHASLYTAATTANIDDLTTYKDQIFNQVTSPARKNTVLHVIAQYNDSGVAIEKLLSGQDPSLLKDLLTRKNSEGETALYIASRNRRVRVVEELLTRAWTIPQDHGNGDGVESFIEQMVRISNKNGDTPLHEAVNNKDKEIVELLVKADPYHKHLTNNMGKTPLYIALEKRVNDDNALGRLVSHFHNSVDLLSSFDPSLKAILEVCKTPGPGIEGPHGETVLHAAARRKETLQWVREICNRIPNITEKQDDRGFNALHYAAYFNNFMAASYLVESDQSMAYITASEEKHKSMTPLHIAASKGHDKVIENILEKCKDSWDVFTSKGQNILHLAAQGQHTATLSYVMKQPWAINLLNMKDNNGNTPSHLLLSSMPKNYKAIKPLLQGTNVYVDSLNNQHTTPLEMFEKAEIQFSAKKVHILDKLQNKFGKLEKIPWMVDDDVKVNPRKEVNKTHRLEELKKTAETHLLVAALIVTVTFAAGLTLPGGYEDNGPNEGMAVLINKAAFQAFVVTDTVAVISSFTAIFLHFTATLYKHDEERITKRYSAALWFLIIAMISMAMTFVTGLYVVLQKTPAIAFTVSSIGCLGILYLLFLIRKVYGDMGVKFMGDQYFFATISGVLPLMIIAMFMIIFGFVKYIFRKIGDVGKRIVSRSDVEMQDLAFHRI